MKKTFEMWLCLWKFCEGNWTTNCIRFCFLDTACLLKNKISDIFTIHKKQTDPFEKYNIFSMMMMRKQILFQLWNYNL